VIGCVLADMPHLIAYSVRNRAFGMAWRKFVVERQRTALVKLLERGIKEGRLVEGLDFNLSVAMLVGPMIYWRFFMNPSNGRAPLNFAEQVVNAFWKAFAKTPRLEVPPRNPREVLKPR
jgi:hypothetical protein